MTYACRTNFNDSLKKNKTIELAKESISNSLGEEMTMEVSNANNENRIDDEAEKNVVKIKNDIVEKLSVKEDEEKKEDSLSVSDEEEYFSNSDSVSSSDTEDEVVAKKVEEEEEEEDDDAYALLAMAKRSLAQAKETEEKLKAEEEAKVIKEAQMEAVEDEDDDDTVFDDDDIEEGEKSIREAESIVEAKIEQTSDTHVKAEDPSVKTEQVIKSIKVEIDSNEQISDQVSNEVSEQASDKPKINVPSETSKVVKEAVDDNDKVEPPKKRREENAELWALLQASKQRLSMTQHHLEEDKKVKPTIDSENSSVDEASDNEKKDQVDSSTILSDNTQNQKLNSDNNVQQLTKEQNLSADDSLTATSRTTQEIDAEAEKQRRRQENAELWELLVQSKRRLEIATTKAEDTETTESSYAMNSDSTHEVNKGKAKDYFNDYVLPEEADTKESNTKSDDEKYDGEDEDEAAIRLSAKELLVAMAVAEEAAISGKDSHQTTILPRTELKRELDTFSFIKSKCSISGPKSFQKTNSEQNDNSYSSSVTSWWYNAPKREKMINGFIKSLKGFRTKTPSNIVSPYKTKSPYGTSGKRTPSSGSGSITKDESTSTMIQSIKNSMKDFQQTVNTIDSKNAAEAKKSFLSLSESGTKVVATPTKRTKWQERAATVAEKNKK